MKERTIWPGRLPVAGAFTDARAHSAHSASARRCGTLPNCFNIEAPVDTEARMDAMTLGGRVSGGILYVAPHDSDVPIYPTPAVEIALFALLRGLRQQKQHAHRLDVELGGFALFERSRSYRTNTLVGQDEPDELHQAAAVLGLELGVRRSVTNELFYGASGCIGYVTPLVRYKQNAVQDHAALGGRFWLTYHITSAFAFEPAIRVLVGRTRLAVFDAGGLLQSDSVLSPSLGMTVGFRFDDLK